MGGDDTQGQGTPKEHPQNPDKTSRSRGSIGVTKCACSQPLRCQALRTAGMRSRSVGYRDPPQGDTPKGYLVPTTTLTRPRSPGPSTRPMSAGSSSKDARSVKENRNRAASASSLQAWGRGHPLTAASWMCPPPQSVSPAHGQQMLELPERSVAAVPEVQLEQDGAAAGAGLGRPEQRGGLDPCGDRRDRHPRGPPQDVPRVWGEQGAQGSPPERTQGLVVGGGRGGPPQPGHQRRLADAAPSRQEEFVGDRGDSQGGRQRRALQQTWGGGSG